MPWFIKALNSLRSKIGADGQNPIVFELWVIMADRKLVARSHSERFPPRQPDTPKHDSRCEEDLVLPSIGAVWPISIVHFDFRPQQFEQVVLESEVGQKRCA